MLKVTRYKVIRAMRCRLTVVMTAAATQFLPPAAVRHIADEVVDGSDPQESFRIGHMRLATEANMVTVLPASAATLSRAANGLAGDLVSAIILASPNPVMFVPSMHQVMWDKPALQRNIKQLQEDGHDIPEPAWRKSFELSDHTLEEHPGLPAPKALCDLIAKSMEDRLTI